MSYLAQRDYINSVLYDKSTLNEQQKTDNSQNIENMNIKDRDHTDHEKKIIENESWF